MVEKTLQEHLGVADGSELGGHPGEFIADTGGPLGIEEVAIRVQE